MSRSCPPPRVQTPTIPDYPRTHTPPMRSEYGILSSHPLSRVSPGAHLKPTVPGNPTRKFLPTPPTETRKSPWFTSLYCNSGETQCRRLSRSRDASPKPTVPKMSLTVSSAPSAAFRTPSPSPCWLSLLRLLSVSPATVSFVPSYQSPSVPHFPTELSPFSITAVFCG